ncbi:30491_t:CDS:2, partial [Racocetra persica]
MTVYEALKRLLLNLLIFQPKKNYDTFSYTMPVINIQNTQESKILFDWKVIPVQTDVTIEQFFSEFVENNILSEHLALVETIEAQCRNSKTTVNQGVDLESWIKKENGGWIGPDAAETIGKPFIQDLTNVLYFMGYNNLPNYKYAWLRFNVEELNEYSDCLLKYITHRWMTRLPFSNFLKELVTKLGEDLSKYAEYLLHKRAETAQNQEFSQPI